MKTVFCRSCGGAIAETAAFCTHCGGPVSGSQNAAWGNWNAWAIACTPIIGAIAEVLLAKLIGRGHSFLFLITLGLNVFLCTIDAEELKRRGISEAQLGNIFLIPVYLFNRAKVLGEKPAYAILWCVLFGLLLLGSI